MFAEIALVNLTALATPALQEAACAQAIDLSLSNAKVTATSFVSEGPYSVRRGGRDFTKLDFIAVALMGLGVVLGLGGIFLNAAGEGFGLTAIGFLILIRHLPGGG